MKKRDGGLKIGLVLVIFIMTIFILSLTWLGVEEIRADKAGNELAVTFVGDLDEEGQVKLHGTIECDLDVVISGKLDKGIWSGTAHRFTLNDSGELINVKYHGSFLYPEISAYDAPHVNGDERAFMNGDAVYVLGEYRVKDGEPVFYLEEISPEEDGFYHPHVNIILVFMFTVIGCLLIGGICVVLLLHRNGYYDNNLFLWRSQVRDQMESTKYISGFLILPVPLFIMYYLYTAEWIFLLLALMFIGMFILGAAAYQKYKRTITVKDHYARCLVHAVYSSEGTEKRLMKLLDENRFRYKKPKRKSKVIELPDHALRMEVIITSYSESREDFDVGVKIGPVTPDVEYTVVRTLKKLIDKEFGGAEKPMYGGPGAGGSGPEPSVMGCT